jgi:hypothetical protein
MDLDSDNPLNGPLTPTSPGLDKHDPIRMTGDEEDNKVNFSSGVREITPQEADSDSSHQEQMIFADDCSSLSLHSNNRRNHEVNSPRSTRRP